MRLKKIPLSNATTAWDLLKDVKRAITEEPKRASMRVYRQEILPNKGGPACGTVGCFAGWVSLLAGTPDRDPFSVDDHNARSILGQDLDYYTVLRANKWTSPNLRYVFNTGGGDACRTTTPRTRAHARAVVQRINRFMAVNETALKSQVLKRNAAGVLSPVEG